jgi:hypothetical protein
MARPGDPVAGAAARCAQPARLTGFRRRPRRGRPRVTPASGRRARATCAAAIARGPLLTPEVLARRRARSIVPGPDGAGRHTAPAAGRHARGACRRAHARPAR